MRLIRFLHTSQKCKKKKNIILDTFIDFRHVLELVKNVTFFFSVKTVHKFMKKKNPIILRYCLLAY